MDSELEARLDELEARLLWITYLLACLVVFIGVITVSLVGFDELLVLVGYVVLIGIGVASYFMLVTGWTPTRV